MTRTELEGDIRKAYEESPTIEEAEKLAAKFLDARIQFGQANRGLNLDVRMKKAALKGAKAGAYIEAATSAGTLDGVSHKKPTEAMCTALVDTNQTVLDAQTEYDMAECDAEEAQNFLDVLKECHLYFRGLSKGRYE